MFGKSEISSVLQAAKVGVRLDGRAFDEVPPIEVATNCIKQANGSAEVRVGENHVIAGVKAEIQSPPDLFPSEGIVTIAVHMAPHARNSEDAHRQEETEQQLSAVLHRLLLSRERSGAALDLSRLGIIPGKACWALSVDCVVFASGGGALDALSLVVRLALADCAVPAVVIDPAIEAPEADDIDMHPDPSAVLRLDVEKLPLIVTACQVGHNVFLGCTQLEEQTAVSTTHVAVNNRGQVCGVVKGSRQMMNLAMMQSMIIAAQHQGPVIMASVQAGPE